MKTWKITTYLKSVLFWIIIIFMPLIFETNINKNNLSNINLNGNSSTQNSLELSIKDEQQLYDFEFNNYDSKKDYAFYTKQEYLQQLSQKTVSYVVQNDFSFFYNGWQESFNNDGYLSKKFYVYICTAFKQENDDLFMNFTYFVKRTDVITMNAMDVKVKDTISFEYDSLNNYWYPKMTFSVQRGIMMLGDWGVDLDANISEPILQKRVDYNSTKAFKLSDYHMYINLEKQRVTFPFRNIKFYTFDKYLYSLSLVTENGFLLREEEFKNSFLLFNLKPDKYLFETSKLLNGDTRIILQSLTYEINTQYQKFTALYFGYYEFIIPKPDFEINTTMLVSYVDIYALDENYLVKYISMDVNYFNLINRFIIDKDYFNNLATIKIIFDQTKINKLILKEAYNDYFTDQILNVDFGEELKIDFNKNDFNNILIENFDEKDIKFYFKDSSKGDVVIEEINKIVDEDNLTINLDATIKINYKNYQKILNYPTITLSSFVYYDFSNANKYIESNFVKDNVFDSTGLKEFLNDQNNWKNFGDYSDNLHFVLDSIIKDNKEYFINFSVFNNENRLLKNDSISIDRKDNDVVENPIVETTEKQDNQYLYFLILLVIPIFFLVYKIFKKILRKKNKI